MGLYFDYLKQKGLPPQVSLANTYFYPSLTRKPSTYRKHIGDKPLDDFEYLIVPVNLPNEDHWLLVVISVIAMCIHIYDSYEQTQEKTLRTIFDTIKDGFLSKERQFVKDKKKRDVMHQDNCTEKIEHCEKQTNVSDCGVFTSLFTKNLLASKFIDCNSPRGINRQEMVCVNLLQSLPRITSQIGCLVTKCQQILVIKSFKAANLKNQNSIMRFLPLDLCIVNPQHQEMGIVYSTP